MLTSPSPNAPEVTPRFESIAPKTPASRLDAWDAARLVATFGIVWAHVCDAHGLDASVGTLGRFGTSYYILAAALFTVRGYHRSASRKFSEDALRKAQRLLWPYVVWSAVYLVYYAAYSYHSGEAFQELALWWGPFAGTALHLWFLPFIFVWGLWGSWTVPRLMKLPLPVLWMGGILASGLVYWFCYRIVFFAVDRPWLWSWHLHRLDRWIDETPFYISAIFLGTAFMRLGPGLRAKLSKHSVSIALASGLVFLLGQVLYAQQVNFIREHTGTDGRFLANLIGLALLCGSTALGHTRLIQLLAPAGRFTYVAFLAHVLVLELGRDLMKSLPGYGGVTTALSCAIVIFAVSLAVSVAVARYRVFRWLRP